jgi:hypothetical protein
LIKTDLTLVEHSQLLLHDTNSLIELAEVRRTVGNLKTITFSHNAETRHFELQHLFDLIVKTNEAKPAI